MNRGNKKVKIGCLFVVEKCRMVILLYGLIIYRSRATDAVTMSAMVEIPTIFP